MSARTATMTLPPRAEATDEPASQPWWRHRIMWLVVGGPAAVVVAGIVTAVIAVRGADVLVDDPAASVSVKDPQAPAMKARNHAATPDKP